MGVAGVRGRRENVSACAPYGLPYVGSRVGVDGFEDSELAMLGDVTGVRENSPRVGVLVGVILLAAEGEDVDVDIRAEDRFGFGDGLVLSLPLVGVVFGFSGGLSLAEVEEPRAGLASRLLTPVSLPSFVGVLVKLDTARASFASGEDIEPETDGDVGGDTDEDVVDEIDAEVYAVLFVRMPSFWCSSSIAGLDSRLLGSLPRLIPPGFDCTIDTDPRCFFCGVVAAFGAAALFDGRARLPSKHSPQHGRPRRSTTGLSPSGRSHPSQRKQRLCHTRSPLSMNPPSLARPRTTLPHDRRAQLPLDPPWFVKHVRQTKLGSAFELFPPVRCGENGRVGSG